MSPQVTVEINQQQQELIDQLVIDGFGETPDEVIRKGFVEFCQAHPELVPQPAGAKHSG